MWRSRTEPRGDAHKVLEEFLVAKSNNSDVVLDDGRDKARFHLNRSFHDAYALRMIWKEFYDEEEYYRDYNAYLTALEATK